VCDLLSEAAPEIISIILTYRCTILRSHPEIGSRTRTIGRLCSRAAQRREDRSITSKLILRSRARVFIRPTHRYTMKRCVSHRVSSWQLFQDDNFTCRLTVAFTKHLPTPDRSSISREIIILSESAIINSLLRRRRSRIAAGFSRSAVTCVSVSARRPRGRRRYLAGDLPTICQRSRGRVAALSNIYRTPFPAVCLRAPVYVLDRIAMARSASSCFGL